MVYTEQSPTGNYSNECMIGGSARGHIYALPIKAKIVDPFRQMEQPRK